MAGKPVVFHVKVNKVSVTNVPALDDDFAKDVSEFDTLEELKADVRKNLEAKRTESIESAFKNAAVEKAVENMTVEMPSALVEQELDRQMENFAYQLQMNGMSVEDYAKMMGGDLSGMRNAMRPAAEKQAKVNLLLDKIAEVENLEITDEELDAEYAKMAENYELELERVKTLVSAEDLKADLKTRKAALVIAESAVAVAPKAAEAE